MSIKSLLLVYRGASYEAGALQTAMVMARVHRATLRILHVTEPSLTPYIMGMAEFAVPAYPDGTVIDRLDSEMREMAERARQTCAEACRHQQIDLRAGYADMVPGQAQALYLPAPGPIAQCLPSHALTADLVISSHEAHPAGDLEVVLSSLLDARRPILVLPRDAPPDLFRSGHPHTVVLAWDGSRAAARALREAVSFMLHAQAVHILRVISPGEPSDEVGENEVRAYLRSHCISAEFIFAERRDRGIAEALVAKVGELKADLLIMGAYGHGHIREMLLGGVTDHVVKNAPTPLLLVH